MESCSIVFSMRISIRQLLLRRPLPSFLQTLNHFLPFPSSSLLYIMTICSKPDSFSPLLATRLLISHISRSKKKSPTRNPQYHDRAKHIIINYNFLRGNPHQWQDQHLPPVAGKQEPRWHSHQSPYLVISINTLLTSLVIDWHWMHSVDYPYRTVGRLISIPYRHQDFDLSASSVSGKFVFVTAETMRWRFDIAGVWSAVFAVASACHMYKLLRR